MIRVFTICCLVLAWAVSGICKQQTELLDLRLGMHDEASRAVLECRGPRPLKVGPLSNSTYAISFHSLDLAPDWDAYSIPASSCLARIEHADNKSGTAIILHTSCRDLWVEKTALQNDHRPGQYHLVLDFWPDDRFGFRPDQNHGLMPDSSIYRPQATKPDPISNLPQGQRRPVRLDLVLGAEIREPVDLTADISKIFGFRVGKHARFTRVVVEVRGQKPAFITGLNNGTVRIGFHQLDLQVPERVMYKKVKGMLRDLRVGSNGLDLELQPGACTKQTNILDTDPPRPGAYRLVMDFSCST